MGLQHIGRDATRTGTLHIIYAHPNGSLLETVSDVEFDTRSLYFSTIELRKVRWWLFWRSPSRPRKPEPEPDAKAEE